MYLKRLELCGFKSFAERTQVNFEKGVTCIVGPNGCGKSNVSDAIRWVLGEKSSKMLRGEKMEDMIFGGTEFRSPLGFCEVTITFSNEDKSLPIDYEEVAITRKYFREGVSEFFINKNPCRQKDIYDLFMDTGVGSNAYCMVEQGRIDYIVKASPEERRFLIEEAAGISKYKSKKEEALRKLEKTENNLLRINDIIAEVEKNIKYAERQARKAEKYKEQYESLKRLEIFKAFSGLEQLEQEKTLFLERKENLETTAKQREEAIANLRQIYQSQKESLEVLEQSLSQAEQSRYEAASLLTRNKDKIDFNTIRIGELKGRNEHNLKAIAEREDRLVIVGEQLLQKEQAYQVFSDEKSQVQVLFDEKNSALERLTEEIRHGQKALEEFERKAYQLASQVALLNNEINSLGHDLSGQEGQKERIALEIEKLDAEEQDLLTQLLQRQAEVEKERCNFEQFSQDLTQKKQSRGSLLEDIERVRQDLVTVRMQQNELNAELKVLEELEKSYGGFQEGAKKALQRKDEQDPVFASVKKFVEFLDVQPGFEQAIQALVVPYLDALVVTSHEEAFRVISSLRDNHWGWVNLLVNRQDRQDNPERLPMVEAPFVLGRAIEFVRMTDEASLLLQELLKKTLIIEDDYEAVHEQLVELSKAYRLVTRSGIVIGPGIYVSGGSSAGVNTSPLLRDRRRQELTEQAASLDSKLIALGRQEHALAEQLSCVEIDSEKSNQTFFEAKLRYETELQAVSNLEKSLAQTRTELEQLRHEQEEGEQEINGLSQMLEEKNAAAENLAAQRVTVEEELQRKKHYLQARFPEREAHQLAVAEVRAKLSTLREKDHFMTNEISGLKKTLEQDNHWIESLRAEFGTNEEAIQLLSQENAAARQDVESLEARIREYEGTIENQREQRRALAEQHDITEADLAQESRRLDTEREEMHTYQMKEMDIQYKQSAHHDRLEQKYRIRLSEVDRNTIHVTEEEIANLDALIERFGASVENMGAVNLLAVDEFSDLKNRFDFLTSQRADLESARTTLLEATRKINRTTRKLFLDVFEQIKVTFDVYYKVLFKGGHAELILVDEENPLESGIDIFVRPPGKKLQNISLLSGGERALTAIALLFAVFKVKPSPYCLLDEVDAPLDEANIDRFLDVLNDFLQTTQFLIITHSRKTIAIGQTLFGVTMEEAGVSKVVSVKVGEEEKFMTKNPGQKDNRESIYKPSKKYNMEKIDALIGTQE